MQLHFEDNVWERKWFPSNRPTDRREVLQLAQTMELMLQDQVSAASEISSVLQIEREQKVYDIVLHELIRQVYVECSDRGILLDRVSKRYRNLFRRIPSLLVQMQEQIDSLSDANKSLRMLLERLMEEKSSSGTNSSLLLFFGDLSLNLLATPQKTN
jgi:hypothetical protein